VTATTPSCPRCGAAAAGRAATCPACGFVFFEPPRQRVRPRWIAVALAVAAAGAGVALLATRDAPPEPPAPVPAALAEARLERQLAARPAEAVRCPGSIEPGRSTRCQFLYADGDTQLMLVTLTPSAELEVDVPYPAQRRPASR
jgi:hypothetical protein